LQKRSHKLLAASLLESRSGFATKRFELAFLFGSFQPDCNPLSYLKGSVRSRTLRGHNYSNSDRYIAHSIDKLQSRRKEWTCWQYYTLGKLTHYLADAFTYPHNDDYPLSLMDHRRYENRLREYLSSYLEIRKLRTDYPPVSDIFASIQALHRQYMDSVADMRRDVHFILEANALLFSGLLMTESISV